MDVTLRLVLQLVAHVDSTKEGLLRKWRVSQRRRDAIRTGHSIHHL